MPMIRIRLIGQREEADLLINALHSIDGIEHVEEVDDPAYGMRDDSSPTELADDGGGRLFRIEVMAPNNARAQAVRVVTELEARRLDVAVEFVDEF
ncbi:hypothetical protein [Frateuria defendens]|uniref:hypothetical protein n=1 Tax=Frateuria defendens TaxID=2219559 RepID=UPI00066FB845|nr:hypothetical protein [Frateuria defendens]